MRGTFKVIESTHYHGGSHRLVTLQSTQITKEMFASEVKLLVNDPASAGRFALGSEVVVEFLPKTRQAIEAPLPAKKV